MGNVNPLENIGCAEDKRPDIYVSFYFQDGREQGWQSDGGGVLERMSAGRRAIKDVGPQCGHIKDSFVRRVVLVITAVQWPPPIKTLDKNVFHHDL